ncbi:MAG: TatD family hydrolase [Candidatus Omnitrophica bacterium]|nr:TatD family hydrolase [Candidatus Omnitrophota bacterium]
MNQEIRLIDTHCHLDFPEFNLDIEKVIKRAKDNGIDFIVNIGSSLEGSKRSIELAKKYDFIYATVGLHPHYTQDFNKEVRLSLYDLAREDKVVAIGEIGLDYFGDVPEPEKQKELFVELIGLAKDLNLPLIIHNRQAWNDILRILKDNLPLKAVFHCFSGDETFLKECLNLGFFVSFTCNITYKKADNLRRLVKLTPLERIFLETDAPFLPPEGLRGKRNEPMYIRMLAEEIARIKGISLAEVGKITTDNALRFFKIKNNYGF